jgi:hypothetical protein
VRTVERELLLRCSSGTEAESWRQAIICCSSTSLHDKGSSSVDGDGKTAFTSSPSGSFSKPASDSVLAEDGDALDATGISMNHRMMTEDSTASRALSFNGGGSIGAIPGWDGKKNSIGCAQSCVGRNNCFVA